MGTPQQLQDGNDLPVVQAARFFHLLSQGAAQVRLPGKTALTRTEKDWSENAASIDKNGWPA
eukprot:1110126-Rhodomonas_salina.1